MTTQASRSSTTTAAASPRLWPVTREHSSARRIMAYREATG